MNKRTLSLVVFLLSPWLCAQDKLKPTDPPELLHQAAMNNLELQAIKWEEIALKTPDPHKKRVFMKLAESYRAWKLIREEKYMAEKNEAPIHYEKIFSYQHQHKVLEEEAKMLFGIGAPELPEEVEPRPTPKKEAGSEPEIEKKYTTESGFNVILRLEE